MATAAEFLYDSCTCDSGMRDGQRCADCGGRGIVPKGTKPTGATIPETELVDDDESDGLEDMSVKVRPFGSYVAWRRATTRSFRFPS